MATGSTTDDGETALLERLSSPRAAGRHLLEGLVYAPGRSAATALVAGSYLWLFGYMATTAFGLRGDPIVAGDWLTLVFTSYALLSSLALAHRILTVGIDGPTREYLVDVVVLTWLTAFYFVWTVARESVSASTAVGDLYRPALDGQPDALAGAAVVGVTAVVTAGLVYRSGEETRLFATEFRTALVTLPGAVTATVLLSGPGPGSPVWPLVGGVFVGTLAGGLLYVRRVAGWTAKGAFAVCSLATWSVGALGWAIVYRTRPPNDHVVLEYVTSGRATGAGREDETVRDGREDETARRGRDDETVRGGRDDQTARRGSDDETARGGRDDETARRGRASDGDE